MLSLVKQLNDGRMIFLYQGNSMYPRFRHGDLLYIQPYRGHRICRGDIVVFSQADSQSMVVHRVAQINDLGIKTRGDNNPTTDSWVLSIEDIIGYVRKVLRRNKEMPVQRGILGRLYITLHKVWRFAKRLIRKMISLKDSLEKSKHSHLPK